MKLRFTPRAIRNIDDVTGYLDDLNPAASKRVQADIFECFQNLLVFPNVGRRQTTAGVRRTITKRYWYLVYYMVDEAANELVILNVKHPASRRDYSDL